MHRTRSRLVTKQCAEQQFSAAGICRFITLSVKARLNIVVERKTSAGHDAKSPWCPLVQVSPRQSSLGTALARSSRTNMGQPRILELLGC